MQKLINHREETDVTKTRINAITNILAELAEGSRKRSKTSLDSCAPRAFCRSRPAGSHVRVISLRSLSRIVSYAAYFAVPPIPWGCERSYRRFFAPGHDPGGCLILCKRRSPQFRGRQVRTYSQVEAVLTPNVCRGCTLLFGPAPVRRCRHRLEKFEKNVNPLVVSAAESLA